MIRSKYNLKCAKGHHHYSPTPAAFVGQSCLKPGPVRSLNYTPVGEKCLEKLKMLK